MAQNEQQQHSSEGSSHINPKKAAVTWDIKKKLVEKLKEFSAETNINPEDLQDEFLDWLKNHDSAFFSNLKEALMIPDTMELSQSKKIFDLFWKELMTYDHNLLSGYHENLYQKEHKEKQGSILQLHHKKVIAATTTSKLGTKISFQDFLKTQKGKDDSDESNLLAFLDGKKAFDPDFFDSYRQLWELFQSKYIQNEQGTFRDGVHTEYIQHNLAKSIRCSNREIIKYFSTDRVLHDKEKKEISHIARNTQEQTGVLSLIASMTVESSMQDFREDKEHQEDGFGGRGVLLKSLKASLGWHDFVRSNAYKEHYILLSQEQEPEKRKMLEKEQRTMFLNFAKGTVAHNEMYQPLFVVLEKLENNTVLDEQELIEAIKPIMVESFVGEKFKASLTKEVSMLEEGVDREVRLSESEKEAMKQNIRYYAVTKQKFMEELYDETILKQSYIEEQGLPKNTFSQSLQFTKKQRKFTPPCAPITSLQDIVQSIDMQRQLDPNSVDPKWFAMLDHPHNNFLTYQNPISDQGQEAKKVSLLPYNAASPKTYTLSGNLDQLPLGREKNGDTLENIVYLPGPSEYNELFGSFDPDTKEWIITDKNLADRYQSLLTSSSGFLIPLDVMEAYEEACLDENRHSDTTLRAAWAKKLSEMIFNISLQKENSFVLEPSDGVYGKTFHFNDLQYNIEALMLAKKTELLAKSSLLEEQDAMLQDIEGLGYNKDWLQGEKEVYTSDADDDSFFYYSYKNCSYYRSLDDGKSMQVTIEREQTNLFKNAQLQLGRALTDAQKILLWESHLYGNNEEYNDGNPEYLALYSPDLKEDSEFNIGYSSRSLVGKRSILLQEGGFTKDEAMDLMRARIAGVPPTKKKKKNSTPTPSDGAPTLQYNPEESIDDQIALYKKKEEETIQKATKQAQEQISDQNLQAIADEVKAIEQKKKNSLSSIARDEKAELDRINALTGVSDVDKATQYTGAQARFNALRNQVENDYTAELDSFNADTAKKQKYDEYKRIVDTKESAITAARNDFRSSESTLKEQASLYDPEKEKEEQEQRNKEGLLTARKKFLSDFQDGAGGGEVPFKDGNILMIKTSIDSRIPGGGKQWIKARIIDNDPESDSYELELLESSEQSVDAGRRFTRYKDASDLKSFRSQFSKTVAIEPNKTENFLGREGFGNFKDNLKNGILVDGKGNNLQYVGTKGKTGKKVMKVSGGSNGVILEQFESETGDTPPFKKTVSLDTFIAMMSDKNFQGLGESEVLEAKKTGNIANKEDTDKFKPKPVSFLDGLVSLKGIAETIKGGFKGMMDRFKENDELRTARFKRSMGRKLQQRGDNPVGDFLYLDDIGLDLEGSYDDMLMSRIEKYASMYGRKAGEGDSVHADNVVKRIERHIFHKVEANPGVQSHEFRLRAMGALKYLCEKGGGPYIRKLADKKYSENGYRVLAILGKSHQQEFLKKRNDMYAKLLANKDPTELEVDKLAKFEMMYIVGAMDGDKNVAHQDIYPQKIIKGIEARGDDNYSFSKVNAKAEGTAGKSVSDMYGMFGAGIKGNNFSNCGALKAMVSESENPEDYPIVFKSFLQLLVSGHMQAGSQFATKKYFDFFKGQARKAFIPLRGYFGSKGSVEKVVTLLDMIAESKGFVKFSDYVKSKPGLENRDPSKIGPDNFQGYVEGVYKALDEWMEDNHQDVTNGFNQKDASLLSHLGNKNNDVYRKTANEFFGKVSAVYDDQGSIPEYRMNMFVGQGIMNANREQFGTMFNFNRDGQFSGKDRVAKDMWNSYEDAIQTFNNLINSETDIDTKKSYMKYFLERFNVTFGDKLGGDQKEILIQAATRGDGASIGNLLESSVLQKKHSFSFVNRNGERVTKEIPNSDNREEVYQNDAVTGINALDSFFRQHASLMTGERQSELIGKLIGDDKYKVVSS